MLRCSYWCSAACSSCVASQQRSYFSGSCRTASAVHSATPRRHVSRLVACCVSCPGFAPAGASPAAGTACIGSRRGLPHRRLSARKRICLQPVLRVGCSGADPMFGRYSGPPAFKPMALRFSQRHWPFRRFRLASRALPPTRDQLPPKAPCHGCRRNSAAIALGDEPLGYRTAEIDAAR